MEGRESVSNWLYGLGGALVRHDCEIPGGALTARLRFAALSSAGFAGTLVGSEIWRRQRGFPTLECRGCVKDSKNTLGRPYPMKDKADPKPTDVFDFPDNSDVLSIDKLGENEQDEEPYEVFAPPLHSTAIYADEEEFSKVCGSSVPSTPQGKEAERSLNISENEANQSESVKNNAQEVGGNLKLVTDDRESRQSSDVAKPDKQYATKDKTSTQQHKAIPATVSSELSGKPAKSVTPKKTGHLNAPSSVEKETCATKRQQKVQKRKKISHGKEKTSRSKNLDSSDSDISDHVIIWCAEGKKTSDLMELDVVLSAFEKTSLKYKQRIESRVCKEAINKFYYNMKEELIKLIKEVQVLKNLKRKNAKMSSGIKEKRQRLIEVQDELLRLEPQLEQLQTKYDELKERKSSLKTAAHFLSNLKQLHQDYSDVQEKEPEATETYDSSSLPALLLKSRGILGAENHLRNINHQLEKLLSQE
ncbi:PREDICTED: centromere protein U [Chrysochloris asiatica]|uniref:Centromere protein U n=1 Tax=Chrysochloris asiatica TaxID=185453 RepID=A0A9B0T9A8_CHRAS|nr:PREDICTED: centromere protein U [Chrysochloris asiatica]